MDPVPFQDLFWQNLRLENYFFKYKKPSYISSLKKTYKGRSGSSTIKFLHCFLFREAIFACPDPDLDPKSGSADPIEAGSNPDSQHCNKNSVNYTNFGSGK
jgi:hypothetical protein